MTNKEIKNMSWQVNSEHDIYDAIVGWNNHRFVCVMSDNTQLTEYNINMCYLESKCKKFKNRFII